MCDLVAVNGALCVICCVFFFQAEDGIRDAQESRGLGDVYKRQVLELGGFQPYRSTEGAWACVRIGDVLATFHEVPIGITTPHHFSSMGISPTAHRLYVVKLGSLHPQLEDDAKRHIMLYSPGLTPLDLSLIPWKHISRPVFPLDAEMTWQP